MDIENITPDREEIFGRLISVGLGRGGYLTVEDIIKPGKYENTDDDIYELLKLLRDENIAVYGWTESDRLDNKRIKEIVETVKNSCEEEKTSNSGGENTVKLYLKEIAEIPLITPDEERSLVLSISEGSEEAKEQLIELSLYLTVKAALQYIGSGVLFLDLVQEGSMALMAAAEEFDYSADISFTAYAAWKINKALKETVGDDSNILKIPNVIAEDMAAIIRESQKLQTETGRQPLPEEIAERLNISADKVKELLAQKQKLVGKADLKEPKISEAKTDVNEPRHKSEAEEQLSRQVADMLAALPEKEAKVISMRFGIGQPSAMTSEEIAEKLGENVEEIKNIEMSAMKLLGG